MEAAALRKILRLIQERRYKEAQSVAERALARLGRSCCVGCTDPTHQT